MLTAGVSFFCVLHTCPSQPATRSSFCRFHSRPHHSSWNREPCGYARFRGFRRPSFDASSTLLSFRTLPARFFHTSLTHRTPAGASPPVHSFHSPRTGEGDVLRTQDGAGTLPECPCWRRERCVTGAYWMRIVSGASGRHHGSFLCIRELHAHVVHAAVLCF